jgi:hypothetical protein
VAKQKPRFDAAGVSALMISIGDADKINNFLELNPNIPRGMLYADASDDFDAYGAANFGKIGDVTPDKLELKPPEGVDWLKYLLNVGKLAPVKKWNEVPEGVLKLGGSFILEDDKVLYGWADAIPGDYPEVEELLKAAGA